MFSITPAKRESKSQAAEAISPSLTLATSQFLRLLPQLLCLWHQGVCESCIGTRTLVEYSIYISLSTPIRRSCISHLSQAEEWLYFHSGTAQATVFIGVANARTIDFSAGDTAVFPDNSGHYILNTSPTENLVWIEIYRAERVADISLTQWLALTPPDIVASTLKIDRSVVDQLKKTKQVLIK